MKKVCLLGAGLVAGPLIEYLLGYDDIELMVADIDLERARNLVQDHPRGRVFQLDLQDRQALVSLLTGADVVVSMVPYTFHPYIAEICLRLKKHLVNRILC